MSINHIDDSILKEIKTMVNNIDIDSDYEHILDDTLEELHITGDILAGHIQLGKLKSLKSISGPKVVEAVGSMKSCTSLISVDLPLMTRLPIGFFKDCINLPLIDLPQLKYINMESFGGCTNLYSVILRFPTLCILESENAFSGTPIANGDGYIYVPKVLMGQYKADPVWVIYSDQIRAIEDYPLICSKAPTTLKTGLELNAIWNKSMT